jgi:hypothetical protein
MLSAAGDSAEQVVAEAGRLDRVANGERLLRELALRTELRPGRRPGFQGEPRAARWDSWCDTPDGWLRRCEVTVALLSTGGRNLAAVAVADGPLVPLREGFATGGLIYLATAARGGAWVGRWDSQVGPPLAIGLVMDRDTLLFRIGERG